MDQKPFFVNQEHFLLYSFYEPPWLDLCKSDDFMSIDLVIFRDMKMPQTNHSSHIVHWYMVEHSGACCEHTDRLKISLSLLFAKKVLIYLYFFVRNRNHMKPFRNGRYLENASVQKIGTASQKHHEKLIKTLLLNYYLHLTHFFILGKFLGFCEGEIDKLKIKLSKSPSVKRPGQTGDHHFRPLCFQTSQPQEEHMT